MKRQKYNIIIWALLVSINAGAWIGPLPPGGSGGGGGGSGTVTSVSLALPSIFTVSGSPVTSSGTLTGALATQAANIVFAGPTGGGAATPTFRSLVASDIPSLSYVNTVGAFSASSQTNGASISTNTITFGPADTTNPGMVSTGSQTVTGNKIFIGPLSAGASSQFNVNTGGNITKINNVATNWPSSQGAASTVLTNDGAGNLSWATASGGITGSGASTRLAVWTGASTQTGYSTLTSDASGNLTAPSLTVTTGGNILMGSSGSIVVPSNQGNAVALALGYSGSGFTAGAGARHIFYAGDSQSIATHGMYTTFGGAGYIEEGVVNSANGGAGMYVGTSYINHGQNLTNYGIEMKTTVASTAGGKTQIFWQTDDVAGTAIGLDPGAASKRPRVISVGTDGFIVKEASNSKMGVATVSGGSITVNNTSVTANSRIYLTCQNPNGGTPGALYVSARTASTGFTITSTSGTDSCIVAWLMIEPGS